jgi:hypothetical protein
MSGGRRAGADASEERVMGRRRKKARAIKMDEELRQALESQLEGFREKFGREPGPGDPVFSDPEADDPRPLDPATVEARIVAAMQAAGIEPAKLMRSGAAVSSRRPRTPSTCRRKTGRTGSLRLRNTGHWRSGGTSPRLIPIGLAERARKNWTTRT